MKLRITTLMENNAGDRSELINEHGLSFHIEYGEAKILMDTGPGAAFLENAATLGIDLAALDHVVISHSHYDHTDGYPHLVDSVGSDAPLHVHRDFFHKKYAAERDGHRYIGPVFDERWISEHGVSLEWVTESDVEIVPGVHIVCGFNRTNPLEVDNPRFVLERDGGWVVDDFRDEIALVIEVEGGIVIIVGCSHPGIMNMIDTVRSRFEVPIRAVIGGTHLVEAQGERLDRAVAFLTDGSLGTLGLSHCTGADGMARLEERSGEFLRNVVGTVLEF